MWRAEAFCLGDWARLVLPGNWQSRGYCLAVERANWIYKALMLAERELKALLLSTHLPTPAWRSQQSARLSTRQLEIAGGASDLAQ